MKSPFSSKVHNPNPHIVHPESCNDDNDDDGDDDNGDSKGDDNGAGDKRNDEDDDNFAAGNGGDRRTYGGSGNKNQQILTIVNLQKGSKSFTKLLICKGIHKSGLRLDLINTSFNL